MNQSEPEWTWMRGSLGRTIRSAGWWRSGVASIMSQQSAQSGSYGQSARTMSLPSQPRWHRCPRPTRRTAHQAPVPLNDRCDAVSLISRYSLQFRCEERHLNTIHNNSISSFRFWSNFEVENVCFSNSWLEYIGPPDKTPGELFYGRSAWSHSSGVLG